MFENLFGGTDKPIKRKPISRHSKPNPTKRLRKGYRAPIEQAERAVSLQNFPYFLSANTKTGVTVTPQTSLTYSTVFACVDMIASTISQLPISIYEDKGAEGKFPAKDHDQYYLIKKEPHKLYSRLQWTKLMIVHYLLWGDGFSIIQRNKFGRPTGYLIVMPYDVKVDKIKDKNTGEVALWYEIGGKAYSSDDIIQWSDLSVDGCRGEGRINSQRESIGLGIALRDYGNELISSGGKTMGYIYHPTKKLDNDAYKFLTQKFMNGYGSDSGVGVLPQGWKYQAFDHPLPPASAEYMASKEFTKDEVCSIFRTPPLLIGYTSGVNNSVAENVMRTWLMSTISPITTMIEMEWDRKIFREREKTSFYVKYNLFALIKSDPKATMEALVQGVTHGIYNKDEARDVLDRNPIPGGLGKDYYQALNMAELSIAQKFNPNQQAKKDKNDSDTKET